SEHNVATLYRAGADSVLSYAAIGATAMWNKLGRSHRVVIAEGSELFTVPMPSSISASRLKDQRIYELTGCHIVGALDANNELLGTAEVAAAQASQLILLGDRHSERKFRKIYLKQLQTHRYRHWRKAQVVTGATSTTIRSARMRCLFDVA